MQSDGEARNRNHNEMVEFPPTLAGHGNEQCMPEVVLQLESENEPTSREEVKSIKSSLTSPQAITSHLDQASTIGHADVRIELWA
eukprot:m.476310 g.476310  ORF g.476310 m.476310 type:complete len:85 (-) comp40608_c0_seq1:356-610(-)